MRKPAVCICKNKDADQLRGNREADQRLCFRYTDSTIPLLPIYKISSLLPSSETVQPGLCRTWSETPKTGFLTTRLNCGWHLGTMIDHNITYVKNIVRCFWILARKCRAEINSYCQLPAYPGLKKLVMVSLIL